MKYPYFTSYTGHDAIYSKRSCFFLNISEIAFNSCQTPTHLTIEGRKIAREKTVALSKLSYPFKLDIQKERFVYKKKCTMDLILKGASIKCIHCLGRWVGFQKLNIIKTENQIWVGW